MKTIIFILLFSLLPGCAGTFEEASKPRLALGKAALPPDPTVCLSLSTASRNWTASTEAADVLSGAAGLVAIPVTDNNARIGLISGAVVAAAWGAFSAAEANGTATSYIADGCGP